MEKMPGCQIGGSRQHRSTDIAARGPQIKLKISDNISFDENNTRLTRKSSPQIPLHIVDG